jgi:arylsulfatase
MVTDPESHERGYSGRKFFAQKLWAPTAAGPILAAHLKSLQDFLTELGGRYPGMKKAIDGAMKKLENQVEAVTEIQARARNHDTDL